MLHSFFIFSHLFLFFLYSPCTEDDMAKIRLKLFMWFGNVLIELWLLFFLVFVPFFFIIKNQLGLKDGVKEKGTTRAKSSCGTYDEARRAKSQELIWYEL